MEGTICCNKYHDYFPQALLYSIADQTVPMLLDHLVQHCWLTSVSQFCPGSSFVTGGLFCLILQCIFLIWEVLYQLKAMNYSCQHVQSQFDSNYCHSIPHVGYRIDTVEGANCKYWDGHPCIIADPVAWDLPDQHSHMSLQHSDLPHSSCKIKGASLQTGGEEQRIKNWTGGNLNFVHAAIDHTTQNITSSMGRRGGESVLWNALFKLCIYTNPYTGG